MKPTLILAATFGLIAAPVMADETTGSDTLPQQINGTAALGTTTDFTIEPAAGPQEEQQHTMMHTTHISRFQHQSASPVSDFTGRTKSTEATPEETE